MTKISKNVQVPQCDKTTVSGCFSLESECHCGSIADKYTTRKYKNSFGYDYYRIFYRCRNCLSRIHNDFIPEIDKLKTFDVVEFMRNNR